MANPTAAAAAARAGAPHAATIGGRDCTVYDELDTAALFPERAPLVGRITGATLDPRGGVRLTVDLDASLAERIASDTDHGKPWAVASFRDDDDVDSPRLPFVLDVEQPAPGVEWHKVNAAEMTMEATTNKLNFAKARLSDLSSRGKMAHSPPETLSDDDDVDSPRLPFVLEEVARPARQRLVVKPQDRSARIRPTGDVFQGPEEEPVSTATIAAIQDAARLRATREPDSVQAEQEPNASTPDNTPVSESHWMRDPPYASAGAPVPKRDPYIIPKAPPADPQAALKLAAWEEAHPDADYNDMATLQQMCRDLGVLDGYEQNGTPQGPKSYRLQFVDALLKEQVFRDAPKPSDTPDNTPIDATARERLLAHLKNRRLVSKPLRDSVDPAASSSDDESETVNQPD